VSGEPICILDQGSYLLVEFRGEFSVDGCKECVDRMVAACGQYRQPKVLLDCRQMTGPLPVFGRFQVAQYGVTQCRQVMRLALLRSVAIDAADTLVEDVAVNRGMDLKTFNNFAAAEQWLGQTHPSSEIN
jgi:hypothetical protein